MQITTSIECCFRRQEDLHYKTQISQSTKPRQIFFSTQFALILLRLFASLTNFSISLWSERDFIKAASGYR